VGQSREALSRLGNPFLLPRFLRFVFCWSPPFSLYVVIILDYYAARTNDIWQECADYARKNSLYPDGKQLAKLLKLKGSS